MNILQVIGQMGYGGAELMLASMAKSNVRKGHRVSIVIIEYCDDDIVQSLLSAGVNIIQLDSTLRSPLNLFRLMSVVRSAQFDIVHTHLFPSFYLMGLISLLPVSDAEYLYTEHSTSNGRRSRWWLRIVDYWMYRRYKKVIAVSTAVSSGLLEIYPKMDNIAVIENGIDLPRYTSAKPYTRDEFDYSNEDIIVFMAGAFRTEKNQYSLVASLKYLPDRYKLLLAGEGPELSRVKSLAEDMGVLSRVTFMGTTDSVERVLAMADTYVLPSFFEGFGLSAVEAAAAALPVVYSRVPGLGDIFEGVGIPIDPTDPSSIAKGIRACDRSESVRAELSGKSYELAQCFDFEALVSRHERLYLDSINADS